MPPPTRQPTWASRRRASMPALKVTGEARYAADIARRQSGLLPAWSPAPSPRAASAAIDLGEAAAVPACSTSSPTSNVGKRAIKPLPFGNGWPPPRSAAGRRPDLARRPDRRAGASPRRFEAAREAAYRVEVDYAAETARRQLRRARRRDRGRPSDDSREPQGRPGRSATPKRRFAGAAGEDRRPTTATPTQHHNPIELFTTTCVWDGDQLTVYEPSQFVYGLQERRWPSSSASTRPRCGCVSPYRRRRLRLEGAR